MKTTKLMQEIITQLAAKHGLDLTAAETHLRLEQPSYMPLVIEKVGKHLLSVAHYYTANDGDMVADPDILFFTGYDEWVPLEIQQSFGYSCVGCVNDKGDAVRSVDVKGQADLASFCNLWARNIKAQGWLEDGVNAKADENQD